MYTQSAPSYVSHCATATTPYSVVVVDDHPLFRKAISQLINLVGSLHLVGEATSAEEGLKLVNTLNPDLVLLDLNLKGASGIDVLKAIKQSGSTTQVVILSASDHKDDVVAALRGGADGYLLKDAEPEDIMSRLEMVTKGGIVLDPVLKPYFNQSFEPPAAARKTEFPLTDREMQIVRLLAQGLCNKRIARQLNITEGTVKVHVKHILRKLDLRSRLEAAVWLLEHRESA